MPSAIPEGYRDILTNRSFAHLAVVLADGTPHVSPVWIDYDGEHILINTTFDRVKARAMDGNPHVSLSVLDPDNPYRYLVVRGQIVEATRDGATEHIDKMARKYFGKDIYDGPGRDRRKLYKIAPVKVYASGPAQ